MEWKERSDGNGMEITIISLPYILFIICFTFNISKSSTVSTFSSVLPSLSVRLQDFNQGEQWMNVQPEDIIEARRAWLRIL